MSEQQRNIHKLDKDVTVVLKSQVFISSLSDALREVIQNSIDASAKNVEVVVDIEQQSFTVKDDGHGIPPSDLSQIGTLHYTSKLRSLNQLNSLTTFGFRGQALHSIGAISTIVIISKTPDFSSSFYTSISNSKQLFGPKLLDEQSSYFTEQPMHQGTIVSVKNLFSNLPVRQLQAQRTPDYKVFDDLRNVILQCTVISPSINLVAHKISHNSKELICKVEGDSFKTLQGNIISKLNAIYGISLKAHHQVLHTCYQGYQVTGVIGKVPAQSKAYQFMIWNNRVLRNLELLKEINKLFYNAGFGTQSTILVPSMSRHESSPKKGKSPVKSASSVGSPYSKNPVFVIVVEGPISISDLIQDPAKKIEVSNHLDVVRPLVIKIMKCFLKANNYSTGKIQTPRLKDDPIPKRAKLSNEHLSSSEMRLILNSKVKMGKLNQREYSGMLSTPKEPDGMNRHSTVNKFLEANRSSSMKDSCQNHQFNENNDIINDPDSEKRLNVSRDCLTACQVISQVDTKFILVKINKPSPALFIIDQHACDERIKVEKILKEFLQAAQDPFHELAIPLADKNFELSFNDTEYELLHHYTKHLNIWGIKYLFQPENRVRVTHLPDLLILKLDSDQDFLKRCLIQYLYDLHNKSKLRSLSKDWWTSIQALPTILIDLINSKACRSAIMFGRVLSKNECEQMIQDLAKCKLPLQCAHGRPSIVPLCELSSFDT